MKVTAGGKDTVGDMQRVVQSIPSSYTVWKDGTQAMAESNVKGGTDYTTGTDVVVINNALTALTGGRTWKERVVLRGNFSISSPIYVPDYTSLIIDGKIDNVATAGEHAIILQGNKTDLWGGHIKGNVASGSAIVGEITLPTHPVVCTTISNCLITDHGVNGIYFPEGATLVTIRDCDIRNNKGQAGIYVKYNTYISTCVTVQQCWLYGNTRNGVQAEACLNLNILGGAFEVNGEDGLLASTVHNLNVQGADFEGQDTADYAGIFSQFGIAGHIDNCFFYANDRGIILDDVDGLQVSNCRFTGVIVDDMRIEADCHDIHVGPGNWSNADVHMTGDLALADFAGDTRYIGYPFENSGVETGTGAQQQIAHGIGTVPGYILLSEATTGGALAKVTAPATNQYIYVTATAAKDYTWYAYTRK